MTSRGVSMFWNVKIIKILKLLNIVKLMNIPKLVNIQKLLDVLCGSLRTIQHRKIPCNFLDKMKYHAITWFTVQYHHMLCNTIQMGHIGPKEPILGPPAGQKRPNTRPKYVVTMSLTQLDRLVAVGIKSDPPGASKSMVLKRYCRQACSSYHQLIFGFASDICICQTQPKWEILRRQCCLTACYNQMQKLQMKKNLPYEFCQGQ